MIACIVSALPTWSSEIALSIAMLLSCVSLRFGITPFKMFTHVSCVALISSALNMGVCADELVPHSGSGRNVLFGGGGSGYVPMSW